MIESEHQHYLMLLSSISALVHALLLGVDALFRALSTAFPPLAFSVQTVPVLVATSFQIRHQFFFIRSLCLCFADICFPKHFPYISRLLCPRFGALEQSSCHLYSFCYSPFPSTLVSCCFPLHSLQVACMCLNMQEIDSPGSFCAPLLF